MTLFKQITLLISTALLLILAAIMALSFQNASRALHEQLYEDAQNTAGSLSLTLGTAQGDAGTMETMINANFDSGHYIRIALHDLSGTSLYERIKERAKPDVPEWFVTWVPITVPTASAQVSAGWNPIALLHVQSDPAHAYVQLFDTARDLLLSFSVIALISLLILNALLHTVLRPLGRVQNQAESILQNRFVLQDRLPFTTEFRDVVRGMNAMVLKVKEIFEKGNEAMARNRELLYNDPVTRLFNRRYLMLKLPELLDMANERGDGMMLLMAFEGAQNVNQRLGRQRGDEFFRRLGTLLEHQSARFDEHIVARINGTEFAIMLPGCTADEATQIARQLDDLLALLKEEYQLEPGDCAISIGLYRYLCGQDAGTLMTKADYALTHAKAREDGNTYLFESKDDRVAMGKEQWRGIIETSLTQRRIALDFWPVVTAQSAAVIQRVVTFSLHDAQGASYPYGAFAAEATALGLLDELYVTALEQLLRRIDEGSAGEYSVRLSGEFLRSNVAYAALERLLGEHAHRLKHRLAFEVSDTMAHKHLDLVTRFDALFEHFGCRMGINQFLGQSSDYGYLQTIRPQFLKAEAAFWLDLSDESLQALRLMTDTMSITLIAAGVQTPQQLEALQSRGIEIIQGPLAQTLADEAARRS
ncbi:MAG: EAL domain-containing protein [Campylobacterales bacterium]|nr:EAL domain-containing protein [Campylobacterales bacterium]